MSSDFLPKQLPPFDSPTPSSAPLDPHIGLNLGNEIQTHSHHYAEHASPEPTPASAPVNHLPPDSLPPPYSPYPEWLSLIMSFCFAGISIAFQTIQASKHLPLSFQMAGLGMVPALAAFVVSKYIPAHLRREAQLLEDAGVFFGVTAFFLDVALSFPLCLKVISWVIYVASILAIILFRYFNAYFSPSPSK